MPVQILIGDVLDRLRELPDESVQCVVTSPPYWGLRSYLDPKSAEKKNEIGLERSLGAHIDALVTVFREIRRVLRRDGTCWVNYGDCYASAPNGRSAADTKEQGSDDRTFRDKPFSTVGPIYPPSSADPFRRDMGRRGGGQAPATGLLKPKDLCMVGARLAIALQDDGWWVRSEIVWHKPNPMPESIRDRPTASHEKIYLLSKSGETLLWRNDETLEYVYKKPEPDYLWRHKTTGQVSRKAKTGEDWIRINQWRGLDYYYNAEAVRVPMAASTETRLAQDLEAQAGSARGAGGTKTMKAPQRQKNLQRDKTHNFHEARAKKQDGHGRRHEGFNERCDASPPQESGTANLRNVWTVATKGFKEAHFATFPPDIPAICIAAGCPRGGTVLDPFGGAGTTALVADRMGRSAIIIELNPDYAEMARGRIAKDEPLFAAQKITISPPKGVDKNVD